MFKIEKNIPLASKKSYPLNEMEVGDSFFVPVTDNQKIAYIRAQIHGMKKKSPGMVVSTRKEETGLRVWLLKKG